MVAVRGIAPRPLSNRFSWVEVWEGDRQRDRQAHRKVAIWIDRPQGHMVESQTGWCSAAPCLCFQPQNLMRVQWNGWGWELIESWELFKFYSLCLALACFNKFTFSCLGNFGLSFQHKHFLLIWNIMSEFHFHHTLLGSISYSNLESHTKYRRLFVVESDFQI